MQKKIFFRFDHSDIGREITEKWDFPLELVKSIGNHHEPDWIDDKLQKSSLTIYISDYSCQMNEIGYFDVPYEDKTIYVKYLKELKTQEKAMNFIIEDVQEENEKMKKGGWFQNE